MNASHALTGAVIVLVGAASFFGAGFLGVHYVTSTSTMTTVHTNNYTTTQTGLFTTTSTITASGGIVTQTQTQMVSQTKTTTVTITQEQTVTQSFPYAPALFTVNSLALYVSNDSAYLSVSFPPSPCFSTGIRPCGNLMFSAYLSGSSTFGQTPQTQFSCPAPDWGMTAVCTIFGVYEPIELGGIYDVGMSAHTVGNTLNFSSYSISIDYVAVTG